MHGNLACPIYNCWRGIAIATALCYTRPACKVVKIAVKWLTEETSKEVNYG